MDREAWQTTVHGITESDMIERLTLLTNIDIFKDAFFTGLNFCPIKEKSQTYGNVMKTAIIFIVILL